MSIRQKLIIFMLFIGLIPTLVVSVVAYLTISKVLTNKTISQMKSLATKQEQRIESLLQKKKEEVIKLANNYDLQIQLGDFLQNGNKEVDLDGINSILHDKKIGNSDIQAIYLTDLQNSIISTTAVGAEGQKFVAPSPFSNSQSAQDSEMTVQED